MCLPHALASLSLGLLFALTAHAASGAPENESAARGRGGFEESLRDAFTVTALPAEKSAPGNACEESDEVRIWVSPAVPTAGAPLGILAVATDAALDRLAVFDDEGESRPLVVSERGGPPWSLAAEPGELGPGGYRIVAKRGEATVACRRIEVAPRAGTAQPRPETWNAATEAFFSAWIEHLFAAPAERELAFPSLEPVLRDPARNFLHDHFGKNEDRALTATPDCADLPYFLRSYFAWKVGLPVAYRKCDRGSSRSPPRCGAPIVRAEFTRGPASPAVFTRVMRELQDAVHSGSARTGLADDDTDFYPLALDRASLRPGTVFADPYGHVLMLVEWVAQTADRPGLLLAVDAQPDNSVTRKRFWEGTFLFADEVASAGPGFKAFRPFRAKIGKAVRALDHDELAHANRDWLAYSAEQDNLAPDDFYARIGALINPAGLDPVQAYEAALDALMEQLETRVTAVENGEDHVRRHPGAVIAMPEGKAIFETIGPWEDYSTPSRDMRLLIAMKVLTGFAERIERHPQAFVLHGASPQQVKAELERHHVRRIQERSVRYRRSDGSAWTLTLADILARKSAFEMGYNPNDCAETRWGARPGSEEGASCNRHAPKAQHARMERIRQWFREAKRPPR
jgi:hypothetical protein